MDKKRKTAKKIKKNSSKFPYISQQKITSYPQN